MKAIQMRTAGGPEVLEVVEKPLPEPSTGEVRVRARAIGISSADMLVRKGTYNWMPQLPAIPGNEMAGVVDALGPSPTTPALRTTPPPAEGMRVARAPGNRSS